MSIAAIEQKTQFLSFMLDDEVYSVDISRVREVLDFTYLTKVPQTPEYMRGVINLRGSAVPVIDLKLKLGLRKTEQAINTCIIITEITLDKEMIVLGMLADSVQEVFDLSHQDIEPAPMIGTQLNTKFLKGMGKKDDDFIMILDADMVFTSGELRSVSKAMDTGM